MDILSLVDRSIRAEQTAAAIYDRFATRFRDDRSFWMELASDERGHANNLADWRRLLVKEPSERWPIPNGYASSLEELEQVLEQARTSAETVDQPDQAFAIAVELESSELDAIYTELLQCSPLSRYPDLSLTRARELERHHQRLVKAIRTRANDEGLQLRADLLEFAD
jgi:rubrerythrin